MERDTMDQSGIQSKFISKTVCFVKIFCLGENGFSLNIIL